MATNTQELYSSDLSTYEKSPRNMASQLLNKLTLEELLKLKNLFNDSILQKLEFVNIIESILESSEYAVHASHLFDQIETVDDYDGISWPRFLQYLEHCLVASTESKNITSKIDISDIRLVPHTKRETIVKVVLIEMEHFFCYVMISKYGRVGLYDGNFNFLTTYHLIMTREDIHRKESERRRRNRWITDALYAPEIQMLITTNSTRSVAIYDASGLNHIPVYLILTTPEIVECLAYKSNKYSEKSTLLMGDACGQIIGFQFEQPKNMLFRKKYSDRINIFYWDELKNESEFVTVIFYGRPHKSAIKKLDYIQGTDTILSCSCDFETALVRKSIVTKRNLQIYKSETGIYTFAFIANILITGGNDGLVKIWNPLICTKPISILKEHKSGIIDLKIIECKRVFLSLSRDGVLLMWDLEELKCIQRLNLEFPSFSVFGKSIEWGNSCLYPGPKCYVDTDAQRDCWERSCFLVMCCEYMAIIKIFFENGNEVSNLPSLPPPPLQNSVLIPRNWESPSYKADAIKINNANLDDIHIDDETIQQRLKDLSFILDKDFFQESHIKNDINFKISTVEMKKNKMRENVAKGAAYLALDLFEVEALTLSPDLPVPRKKTLRNLVDSTQKLLSDASQRDIIFSESSSRSPRSPRSSIVEFTL